MIRTGLAIALVATAVPAHAEVVSASETGFIIELSVPTDGMPDDVWARLISPATWWSSTHSWSGDAANMTLDPVIGGCFCETWAQGAAEHGRVIHVVAGRMLRLSAPLGPLQAMAVTATLTFEIKPKGAGSAISARYIVGGNFGMDATQLAPAVDAVLRQQMASLAKSGDR